LEDRCGGLVFQVALDVGGLDLCQIR